MDTNWARRIYPERHTVFKRGEPGDEAYLIERGRVVISVPGESDQIVVATLKHGDVFGEMALLDSRPRTATATALEDTTLIPISREQVESKLRRADPLLSHFLKVILARFRMTQDMFLESGYSPTETTDYEKEKAVEGAESSTQRFIIGQIRMAQDLQDAIAREEFELFYQPIIRLGDGILAGFEALIRWNRPAHGFVPPVSFIKVAEDTGLIDPIGRWVLSEAGKALRSFQKQFNQMYSGMPPIFMSVNLSARQLSQPGEVNEILKIIESSPVQSENLKLEITESVLMGNPDQAAVFLNRLKETGISLAIDDFGTGYSSLSYLSRFSLDTMKIDRSFVNTMLVSTGSMQIIQSVISLGFSMGMDVVAEGVEQQEEVEELKRLGCTFGQGYLFSRPLPETQVDGFIVSSPWAAGPNVVARSGD